MKYSYYNKLKFKKNQISLAYRCFTMLCVSTVQQNESAINIHISDTLKKKNMQELVPKILWSQMPSVKFIDNLEKDNKRLKATNWQLKGQHE